MNINFFLLFLLPNVFVRATRDIPANSELRVWFSNETMRDLHIEVPPQSGVNL